MPNDPPRAAPDYEPTTLGFALLGLLRDRPQTGYEIRRIFAETPMGTYSSSPGTIYPALKRLQEAGLVTRVPKKADGTRQNLALTQAGHTCLLAWLQRPVAAGDVEKHYDELMLRFAFMNDEVNDATRLRFLRDLGKELKAWLNRLHDYLKSHGCELPLNGRLALGNGIAEVTARLHWARRAYEIIRKTSRRPADCSNASTRERCRKRTDAT